MKLATNRSILIELTIKVFPKFFWEIFAFLKQLGAGKPYLECFPLLLTVENLEMFLKQRKDSKFCFRIKELQNCILCITRVWSLVCSERVYISLHFLYIFFWKSRLLPFSVFSVFSFYLFYALNSI